MKPPKHLRKFHATMVKAFSRALGEMMHGGHLSHSFNVVNNAAAYTMLILWTKSVHDQEIYLALKPLMDREYGEGTLVEPNYKVRPGMPPP